MTATPPVRRPSRSCSFSLSYSEVVLLIYSSIESILSLRSSLEPPPPKMMVSSLVTITFLATPNTCTSAVSNFKPMSSLINYPPVVTAISYIVFLLLSPKPGLFTAHTFNPPLNLFITRVANASESTSSATISSCLPPYIACSKK